jgi:hypothetical protein
VPVGEPLELTGSLDRRDGRKLHVSGEIRLTDGRVAATATGLFLTVPLSHFAPYAPAR